MRAAALTRREALALLLGAPLAEQACRSPRRRTHPGRLLGTSLELGHRLRAEPADHSASAEISVRIAIVGAGPSGLSAAWRLERLGFRDFVVLELEPEPGGTSAYASDGVVPHPWGAHYVPMPTESNPALVTLLGEMGVLSRAADGGLRASERARVRAPAERLYLDGVWHEGLFPSFGASAADVAELRRFEALIAHFVGLRDGRGRRAFAVPMRLGSDDAELTALDRISARRWLEDRGFRSQRLHWYVGYACRDDYGLDLERTSAWAMLFYFAARVAEPGRDSQPFLTWPEGNGRIVAHLARVAGERVVLGRLVTDVIPSAGGVLLHAFEPKSQTRVSYRAERAILAVPKFVTARIVRPFREHPPAHLAEFRYGSWLVANLHLARRPKSRGFACAWDNVLYDSPSLGYVVATHQALSDTGPSIWTYYLPLVGEAHAERRRLAELDHAACADAVLSDLGRAHDDLEACLTRIDIWRWGHAMVSPVPGFIWGGARARAAEPLQERVFFAHSDLSGLALFEEAQDRGVQAAEAALRSLGRDLPALSPG